MPTSTDRAAGSSDAGNLVALLHGTDKKAKAILLLAHIDVVEAKREDWVRDPFTLVEEDGYFYGRGTADDKAMAAIFVDAMMRYKKSGYKPTRDIKMALTCGEETPYDFDGAQIPGRKQSRSDRRRIRHQRRRRRRAEQRRPTDLQRRAGRREGVSGLPSRSDEPRRPFVAAGQGQRDLSPRRGPHATFRRYQFPIQFNDTTRGFFERMSTIETGQVGKPT